MRDGSSSFPSLSHFHFPGGYLVLDADMGQEAARGLDNRSGSSWGMCRLAIGEIVFAGKIQIRFIEIFMVRLFLPHEVQVPSPPATNRDNRYICW